MDPRVARDHRLCHSPQNQNPSRPTSETSHRPGSGSFGHLRKFILTTEPRLQEKMLWGNPGYVLGKHKVAFIYTISDHVNFGFFHGTKIKDPYKLLEGTGKGMRHIKVRSLADIKKRQFAALLKRAVALAK